MADTTFFGIDTDLGLVVTVTGVLVAGFAAVLGIWMERDDRKPPRYAYALSGLILLATLVSVVQSWIDEKEQDQLEEDMARVLAKMEAIASKSENAELAELVKSELNVQTRAHPDVVSKLAQRVSDEGRDPTEVLAKHLDAADVESVARKSDIKPRKLTEKTQKAKEARDRAAQTRKAAAAARAGRPAAALGERVIQPEEDAELEADAAVAPPDPATAARTQAAAARTGGAAAAMRTSAGSRRVNPKREGGAEPKAKTTTRRKKSGGSRDGSKAGPASTRRGATRAAPRGRN